MGPAHAGRDDQREEARGRGGRHLPRGRPGGHHRLHVWLRRFDARAVLEAWRPAPAVAQPLDSARKRGREGQRVRWCAQPGASQHWVRGSCLSVASIDASRTKRCNWGRSRSRIRPQSSTVEYGTDESK